MSNEIIEAYVVATYDDDKGYNIFSLHNSLEEANNALRDYNNEIEGLSDELGSLTYLEDGKLITKFMNVSTNAQAAVSKCTIEFID